MPHNQQFSLGNQCVCGANSDNGYLHDPDCRSNIPDFTHTSFYWNAGAQDAYSEKPWDGILLLKSPTITQKVAYLMGYHCMRRRLHANNPRDSLAAA